jgi:thiol-disulfide isomerase/thioredoxin
LLSKPYRPRLTRRSLIATAAGLAFSSSGSKYAIAQITPDDLPDALDAITKIMPQTPPNLTFTTPKGKQLSLANYRGHPLIVNLWATWCGPCVAEIPSFAALAATLKPAGILILPISIDLGGAQDVRPFYASHNIHNLPILLDPNGDNMTILGTNSVPFSLIINAAGQAVATLDGAANWNTPGMIAYLKSLGTHTQPGNGGGFMPV